MKNQAQPSTKQESKVLPCHCKSAYQDDTYGIGRRVHNATKGAYRCTVCQKINQA